MTLSARKTAQRKQQNNQAAIDRLSNKYNNADLTQGLSDWLGSGGYEDWGSAQNGYLKNSGGKWTSSVATNRIDDIINDYGAYKGQQLQNAVYNYGDPANYKSNFYTNQQLNDLKNSYLDDQYTNALNSLDAALKRGTLTQAGYDKAFKNLGTQRSAANSLMNSTIDNWLGGYDDEFRKVLNNYNNKAGEDFDLGLVNTYNPENLQVEFNDVYGKLADNLEGDFYNQMAGTQFFDPSSLIGEAKVQQGVTNQGNNLLGAIEENEQKKNKKVGLGNQGLF
ncbi:MAG: hypothetical protein IKT40_01055 [Bacilli bacterium]|nr:hypothetical protein [Bacilli bacterium]